MFSKILPKSFTSVYSQSSLNTANIPFMYPCIIFRECKKVTPSNICFVYPLDSFSQRTLFFFMWSDNDPWRKATKHYFNLEFATTAPLNISILPPFSLMRDFGKQNTRGNVSKIFVNHTRYRQIGSQSTNHRPLA